MREKRVEKNDRATEREREKELKGGVRERVYYQSGT